MTASFVNRTKSGCRLPRWLIVKVCLPSRLSLQVLCLVQEDLEKELGNICYRPVTKGNSEQPNGNA